jgi:hypothetical protein
VHTRSFAEYDFRHTRQLASEVEEKPMRIILSLQKVSSSIPCVHAHSTSSIFIIICDSKAYKHQRLIVATHHGQDRPDRYRQYRPYMKNAGGLELLPGSLFAYVLAHAPSFLQ